MNILKSIDLDYSNWGKLFYVRECFAWFRVAYCPEEGTYSFEYFCDKKSQIDEYNRRFNMGGIINYLSDAIA